MHDLGSDELKEVAKVFKGPILTTGNQVSEFETKFADLMGGGYALGVTSCTAALQLSIQALGIQPGDEVITSSLTFLATASAIEQAGARPVFADVDPDTGNLDPDKVVQKINKKTKAVIVVHLYGLMCDMEVFSKICRERKLFLIEDAAHCIEGERGGIRPGQKSDAACFSFYATKNMTCGEGGAVLTRHASLYKKLKLLRHHGMSKTAFDRHSEGYRRWDMKQFGWKYNMDNIHAAILLPQIKRLKKNLKKRKNIASYYNAELSSVPGIQLFRIPEKTIHACHLYVIQVDSKKRDRIISCLYHEGVEVMVNYNPVHLLTYYKKNIPVKSASLSVAEKIGQSVISLPFYPRMTRMHAAHVVKSLKKAMNAAI